MARLNITNFKNLSRLKRSVCLFTRHHDGDKYHGVLLAAHKDLLFLETDNDFVFDGIIALPTRKLKFLRCGPFEKTLDQIFSRYGLLKIPKRPSWLAKIETIQQLIGECHSRKLWPIIEVQSKRTSALFIGPITNVGKNDFHIFGYDATGKWEKNYQLTYKEILKVQLFDKYSTYFNRFVREKTRSLKRMAGLEKR